MTIADFVIQLEAGKLDEEQLVAGMADLVRSGLAWQLQGAYGRLAKHLIETGRIDAHGNILE
jgi:hypothetical protein